MVEFKAFPKMQRYRDSRHGVSITEKIDGTNAAIHIQDEEVVGVQSRKRLITVDSDNFGFARWVEDRKDDLARVLGNGTHYGEFWGSGIQRGYGLTNGDKRFSLFNAVRWIGNQHHDDGSVTVHYPREFEDIPGLGVVPELYRGSIKELGLDTIVDSVIENLRVNGSAASKFDRPEGVVVFFLDSRTGFKHIPEGWEPGSKKATRG